MRRIWSAFVVLALAAVAIGAGPCSGAADAVHLFFFNTYEPLAKSAGAKKAKAVKAKGTHDYASVEVFADTDGSWNFSGFHVPALSGAGKKSGKSYKTSVSNTQELLDFIRTALQDGMGVDATASVAKLSATAKPTKKPSGQWAIAGTITYTATVDSGEFAGRKLKGTIKISATSNIFG